MVRIKTRAEIVRQLSASLVADRLIGLNPSKLFSNLFVAYAMAFNKQELRKGALFERPFCRIEVENLDYFKSLVVYIHRNPIHHGFVDNLDEYEWSSYHSYFSVNPSGIHTEMVMSWFDSLNKFRDFHTRPVDAKGGDEYILDDDQLSAL
jgi:hypothetical protein